MRHLPHRLLLTSLAALTLASCTALAQQAPAPVSTAVVSGQATAAQPTAATAAAQAAAAAYDFSMDVFHPVVAYSGMVATDHALASRIGLEVLQSGGNAVDAAVAVGFALAVAMPYAGNIGGGGFMLVHNAQSAETAALDFRETAPAAASRNMYLDLDGQVINGKSLYTHFAVGVPGTVAGLTHALDRWGSQPLGNLLQPAIELAEDGYTVSETLAKVLSREVRTMGPWPATRAIFWKDGAPLKAGDTLVQKDLARSLHLIARDGARAFYEGNIAQLLANDMARHGHAMTLQDLKDYRVVERKPVRGSYRGHEIMTMPPPSSGGTHLVQILNMMEDWPVADWGHNSAQTMHHMTEAMKLAYADRAEYLGDPDFVQVPLAGLTSRSYARALTAQIDARRARPAGEIKASLPQAHEGTQTTHYSVIDAAGNMVGVTYTLNTNFGSGIVAEGTGIVLNNEMDDFSAKPGVPNAYGVIGGDANAVQAGKRPLSSMTPTFVFKDGKPWLVTGTPGGPRIITTVLQQIVNAIDFDMNPAEAGSQLRFHHQWTPDELRVEKGFSVDTLDLLRAKGQNVVVKPTMGRTQTIQVQGEQLWGWSDPRHPDGLTLGY